MTQTVLEQKRLINTEPAPTAAPDPPKRSRRERDGRDRERWTSNEAGAAP